MSTNPIWITGYGAPVTGAAPVWIAGYGAAVSGAAEAWIAGYGGTPTGGASPVWVAGCGGTPTGGASSIWIGGYITSGGAGALTPAQTYLARTVGGNEGGNAANITTLINGLVADGVWSKLDALYVLAQQNAADSLLNLVGTNYTLTKVGLPTFTQYRGYSGFTPTAYLSTNFNAATAVSPFFTRNSASLGLWSTGTVGAPESTAEFGNSSAGATGESHLFTNYTGGLFYARINDPSVGSVTSAGVAGFFGGDRPSSSSVVPYYNGAVQTAQSSTSQAVFNGNFTLGWVSGIAGSSDQFAEAHISGSLGSAGNLALYTRLRTYMTAVGVP